MAWVLPEVLGPIDHVPLASKEVNSVRDTLCIDVLPCTLLEVLFVLKAEAVLHTSLEHLS